MDHRQQLGCGSKLFLLCNLMSCPPPLEMAGDILFDILVLVANFSLFVSSVTETQFTDVLSAKLHN